ncbi:MAG: hypothetical protein IJX74_06970 [Clostridia bacterium]|nr:hypothetical protein [Clostridia bacterium]
MKDIEIVKQGIEELLVRVREENQRLSDSLTDTVSLAEYSHLAKENDIWTDAFEAALAEHEVVVIPASDKPYRIDKPVIIPSNRKIIAEDGANIRLARESRTQMMRNERTVDGTHYPIKDVTRAENITIIGGLWEHENESRGGYGKNCCYDENNSIPGVSSVMFFENLDHLTLKNMTFKHSAGFSVQMGEISNVIIQNIRFIKCFADGIHINGNTQNVWIRDVEGHTGDDLVALNMYDWYNSSMNFGPAKNIICEDMAMSEDMGYKALRLLPGMYKFKDGSEVDCSLTNAIFRRISGVKTYKFYLQTPSYIVKNGIPYSGLGSADNIFFEDITVDLVSPIDDLPDYINSDPVTGTFAAFEFGSNIGNLYFKNIDVKLYREKYPYSYIFCVGPKSVRMGEREIFNPYLSSEVENVYLEDIKVNGVPVDDVKPYVREIEFDNLYDDGPSTGNGKIKNLHFKS